MGKPVNVTHTEIESFVACNPMDQYFLDAILLTRVGGVEVSAIPRSDCRGLMITVEESPDRIQELAFTQPVAIRNAVYAVVNALGELVRFTGMGVDFPDNPPWFEFAAETQWDEA